jgi:hypothetical protein
LRRGILLCWLFQAIVLGQERGPSYTTLPTTVMEAHDRLLSMLPDSVIQNIRTLRDDDLGRFHLDYAQWLESRLGLSQESSELRQFFDSSGISDPFVMSFVILKTFRRKLRTEPILLVEHIQQYVAPRRLSRRIFSAICPLDRSEFTLSEVMESFGPPYSVRILAACVAHQHYWVFQKGKPAYRPNRSLLARFRSGVDQPKGVFPIRKYGKPLPVPDSGSEK